MKFLIFLLGWITVPAVMNLTLAETTPPKTSLTATLVDAAAKAQKKSATVEVTVVGIQLIDPAKTGEIPAPGQGHIHYQVDQGFIIATTTPKLSFHGLTSGTHKITVSLAANDHSALGTPQVLTVTVP